MGHKVVHTISEYDCLHCKRDMSPRPGYHMIDAQSFDAIKQFVYDTPELNNYIVVSSKRHYGEVIRVQNYVGVLQTKQGISVEILPKIYETNDKNIDQTRHIFLKMLRKLKSSPFKKAQKAHLLKKDFPILEVFIGIFLDELEVLVKQGLKKSYQSKEDNLRFLKGKLNVMKQIQYNTVHKERFAVTYDEFTQDCAENRLIKTCIYYLQRHASRNSNQKRLREMIFIFDAISSSANIDADFARSNHTNRLQSYYSQVIQRVALFLGKESLVSFSGKNLSLALLFPMEKIFEDYVASIIRAQFPDRSIRTQDTKHHLIEAHQDRAIFQLRPDIVMCQQKAGITQTIVLDTKRKLIDETNGKQKYNISQADIYQLFAYAQKYNCEEVYLVYPKTERFAKAALAPFAFYKGEQSLHVVSFDVETDTMAIFS